MITGAHVILMADDPVAARAFFRDVLGWAHVDDGEGWLIFALPPGELGIHPAGGGYGNQLYLMCDDLEATVAALEGEGVEVTGPPRDEGWGLLVQIQVPGLGELGLYEPKHKSPLSG